MIKYSFVKKYQFFFSVHTLLIAIFSLVSSYVALRFKLSLYTDFLIVGVIIAFPISFAMREAFRRRERAIEYLSQFKASLYSIFYSFETSKLEREKKLEVKAIISDTSNALMRYLSEKSGNYLTIQQASGRLFIFIQDNEEYLKGSFSLKILLFFSKVNESIEFLIATKRHKTPWAVRLIIILGIYMFVAFYPASLLNRMGFNLALWYVFVMTFFKALILVCLYNIQSFLEDPFNKVGGDEIKLDNFQFSGLYVSNPVFIEKEPMKIVEKASGILPTEVKTMPVTEENKST